MKTRFAILVGLATFAATPVHAEKLSFDHRITPELGAVLDSGRKEMVLFDDSNPDHVLDRIAIAGASAQNWTEALEIIVRKADKAVHSSNDWMQEIRSERTTACRASLAPISQDGSSLTFARRIEACGGAPAETDLYRIVAGRKSLYLLSARYKGEMSDARRRQWLAMFATARVEN